MMSRLRGRFANRKFYREDFSGEDLSNGDLRNITAIECKFIGTNLSYANAENGNFWGSDFTDAICYRFNAKDAILAGTVMMPQDCFGMTLSMSYESVAKMVTNERFLMYWLFMGAQMIGPSELSDRLLVAIGGADSYARMDTAFRKGVSSGD
jgi:uncharacterized protein YjbI with pentapeptide repeats